MAGDFRRGFFRCGSFILCFLAVLLIFLLIFGAFSTFALHGGRDASDGLSEAEAEERISEEAREDIRRGLFLFSQRIELGGGGVDEDVACEIFSDILKSEPYLFFVSREMSYVSDGEGRVTAIIPQYNMSRAEALAAVLYCRERVLKISAPVGQRDGEAKNEGGENEKIGANESANEGANKGENKGENKSANEGENEGENGGEGGGKSEVGEREIAAFFHDYICENFEYDTSLESDCLYTILRDGVGTCRAYSMLYIALLRESGIDATYAVCDETKHMWNMARIDGAWYHFDVTWDDVGEGGKVSRKYFMLTDSEMRAAGRADWRCGERGGE